MPAPSSTTTGSVSRQEHPRGTSSRHSPGIPARTAMPAGALAPVSGGG